MTSPASGIMSITAQNVKRSRVRMSNAPRSSSFGRGVVPPVPSSDSSRMLARIGQRGRPRWLFRPRRAASQYSGSSVAHGTSQNMNPKSVRTRKFARLPCGMDTCVIGSLRLHSQYGSTTMTSAVMASAPYSAPRYTRGSTRYTRRRRRCQPPRPALSPARGRLAP